MKLYQLTKKKEYIDEAIKALKAIEEKKYLWDNGKILKRIGHAAGYLIRSLMKRITDS